MSDTLRRTATLADIDPHSPTYCQLDGSASPPRAGPLVGTHCRDWAAALLRSLGEISSEPFPSSFSRGHPPPVLPPSPPTTPAQGGGTQSFGVGKVREVGPFEASATRLAPLKSSTLKTSSRSESRRMEIQRRLPRPSPLGGSVTYVSGLKCYLCPRLYRHHRLSCQNRFANRGRRAQLRGRFQQPPTNQGSEISKAGFHGCS